MKWSKLGKIFDPTEHKLPNDCLEFAQSPQALVLKDRVRVYFSTRRRDEVGKYLSHVAYVDFVTDFKMHSFPEGSSTSADLDEVQAGSPDSILVSSDSHLISQYIEPSA